MTRKELINFINGIVDGKSKYIETTKHCYAVNANGYRGIAVETLPNVLINESFNKINIVNCKIDISEVSKNVIFLYTKESVLQNQYGLFCLDFIENEDLIRTDPLKWFNLWKDMIGNVKQDKMVYDFIGELKI